MVSWTTQSPGVAAAEAELFKALAHPVRSRVLGVLTVGPASVPDLCAATGMKPSHLAGHLARLRAQQLITGRRSGGRLFYHLSFPEIVGMLAATELVLSARSVAGTSGVARDDGPMSGGPGARTHAPVDEDARAQMEESVAFLEWSLGARAMVAEAVQVVSARTGASHEEALSTLLTAAREQQTTLAQAALDVVSGRRTV